MGCFEQALPVIVYLLLIILIVVLIVVLVRALFMLNKMDKLIDDVSEKVNSLQSFFNLIDSTADTFSLISDKIIGIITGGISKIFKKKEDDKDE